MAVAGGFSWCQWPSHFFRVLYSPKEHPRSFVEVERTIAKQKNARKASLSHRRTQVNHVDVAIIKYLAQNWSWCDRDRVFVIYILALQLREDIEGTLANLLSHRKTRMNHDDVAIMRHPTSATNSLCQFLVSTIRALRRTSGIFISANFQYFFILKNSYPPLFISPHLPCGKNPRKTQESTQKRHALVFRCTFGTYCNIAFDLQLIPRKKAQYYIHLHYQIMGRIPLSLGANNASI
jgi:hypothetical protein